MPREYPVRIEHDSHGFDWVYNEQQLLARQAHGWRIQADEPPTKSMKISEALNGNRDLRRSQKRNR